MFDVLFAKEKQEMMEQKAVFNGRISASMGITREAFLRHAAEELESHADLAIQAYDEVISQQQMGA